MKLKHPSMVRLGWGRGALRWVSLGPWGAPVHCPRLGVRLYSGDLIGVDRGVDRWGKPRTAPQRRSVLVLAEGREAFQSALQVAVEMRGGGSLVEVEVCGRVLAEGLAYARKKGLTEVIVVQQNGKRTTHSVE